MKFSILFIMLACMQVSASSFGQQISISGKRISLEKVFNELKKQSGYTFFYSDKDVSNANKVTIDVKNVDLKQVLHLIFANQPLSFKIIDKTVVVKEKLSVKEEDKIEYITATAPVFVEVKGIVLDEEAKPIEGVSVLIEGTKSGTTTNIKGFFNINASPGQTLVISAIGYESQQIKISASTSILNIVLKKSEKKEEAVVINTGLFARKKESYTGATATFSGNELRNVGNMNLVQSLKSLDPSFLVLENNLQGANPNASL